MQSNELQIPEDVLKVLENKARAYAKALFPRETDAEHFICFCTSLRWLKEAYVKAGEAWDDGFMSGLGNPRRREEFKEKFLTNLFTK